MPASHNMDNNEYEPSRQRKKPKVKESIIDHTYRDYSQVEVSSDEEGDRSTADGDKKQSRLQPNFPAKLHAIVSNPNYQHIVCWQVRLDVTTKPGIFDHYYSNDFSVFLRHESIVEFSPTGGVGR